MKELLSIYLVFIRIITIYIHRLKSQSSLVKHAIVSTSHTGKHCTVSFNEILTLQFFIHKLKSQNHPVKHNNIASRGKTTNCHNLNLILQDISSTDNYRHVLHYILQHNQHAVPQEGTTNYTIHFDIRIDIKKLSTTFNISSYILLKQSNSRILMHH